MTSREEFIKAQKVRAAKELVRLKKEQKAGLYPKSLSFPIGMQFELTAQCNLFCKHCYNRSYQGRPTAMTIADWQNVVQDVIAHGGIFQCILSGGEPLLIGKDIFSLMDPLSADGTAFVIITNGYLVDESWVKQLKKYDYYWVQVSIDHLIPEMHDEFRGKKGSWERARRAALMFSSAGFPLRIAHSLTPQSIQYLEEFAEFAYKLGASSLICGDIMVSGRANEHKDLLMDEDCYEKLYTTVDKLRKKYSSKMDILLSSVESVDMRRRQKSVNSSIIIRPDGSVRLDCTMPFTIGNVLERPFSSIWQDKGNTCWKHPSVDAYIREVILHGYDSNHINHVMPDTLI